MRNINVILLCLVLLGSFISAAPVLAGATPESAHVSAEVAPVAGGHAEEGPGMFDWDKFIILSQLINFFVLLFLLKRFLYVPITAVLEERRRKIAEAIAAAEAENRKGTEYKVEYQKKLGAVEQEAYQIKQQAIGEAQSARDEILAGAKTRSLELVEKAHKDIVIERKKAWVEMREEVVRLSLAVAERVIEKSLDDKEHHELIGKAIEGLEKSQ
ncbi:MAG: F0F1 ATP synthase subunit B [Candidatus Ozemobacteraceae bacterium]